MAVNLTEAFVRKLLPKLIDRATLRRKFERSFDRVHSRTRIRRSLERPQWVESGHLLRSVSVVSELPDSLVQLEP